MSVVTEMHDLAVMDREDREQLPAELHAGEFLAGAVADAEDGVTGVGQQFERVHIGRLPGRGTQPGEHLRAPLAG